MNQNEAITVLKQLKPDFSRAEPSSVLIKYAREMDLAPAQLEKLGQCYNTYRTLSAYENEEDRGATVPLIEVPAMLADYCKMDTPVTKKAAELPTHDPHRVDLMRAVVNMAFPESTVKAAAESPAPVDAPVVLSKHAFVTLMTELAGDISGEIWERSQAVCKSAKDRVLDLYEHEEHAMHVCHPGAVSRAITVITKCASAVKFPPQVARFDGELVKRSAEVSTDESEHIVRIAELLVQHDLVMKAAAEAESVGRGLTDEELMALAQQQMAAEGELASAQEGQMSAADFIEAQENSAGPRTPSIPLPAVSGAGWKGPTNSPAAAAQLGGATSGNPVPRQAAGADSRGDGGGSSGGGGDSSPARGNKIADLIRAAGAPVSAVSGALNSASEGARGALGRITGKERVNSAQMRTDGSVNEIIREIRFRRMVGTDKVLREAPIRDVVDAYNTIAKLNPEVAANPDALRLVLREAVSYEGLPLDAQTSLANLRKTTTQADASARDETRSRYMISGSGAPSAPTKK